MKNILSALVLLSLLAMPALTIQAQTPPIGKISVSWEELTSADFVKATHLSQGLCILPMGVVEKHGQHLPLGTDVFIARELSLFESLNLMRQCGFFDILPFCFAFIKSHIMCQLNFVLLNFGSESRRFLHLEIFTFFS